MAGQFQVKIAQREQLSDPDRAAVITLCSRAFEIDYAAELPVFTDATHLLGLVDGDIVSHAVWYTRWLQAGDGPLLRTAYVEGVATAEAFRRRGYASMLMQRLVEEAVDYDLAALSPSDAAYYARLGWELWKGPLFIRMEKGPLSSPPYEEVMIFRLPGTPAPHSDVPLSAEWREGELW